MSEELTVEERHEKAAEYSEDVLVHGVAMYEALNKIGEMETEETSTGDVFLDKMQQMINNASDPERELRLAAVGRDIGAKLGSEEIVNTCNDIIQAISDE